MIWPSLKSNVTNSVVIQANLSCLVTLSSISSAYAEAGLRRKSSIKARIFWNKLFDTATSANWKVT